MSAKKSFSGTPYSRPPSTPRQQAVQHDSAPGSILKTLFSPANWFGKKSSPQQDGNDQVDSSGSESSEEDEEEQIGLNSSSDQVQTANTPKMYPSLPQTPVVSPPGSQSGSPNAVLASFFTNKGDTPLTEVELEGVKALLARQTSNSPQTQQSQTNIPSYATPARRPYQPIFTPAKMTAATGAATEVRRVRRTGYTPSTSAVSPFRRNAVRTGFVQPRAYQSTQPSTPSKYELRTTISSETASLENGKRGLEEIAAPAAKRSKQDESQDKNASKSSVFSTGNKTAASILEILDSDGPTNETETSSKSPEQLKTMLNPYASSASPRKPVTSVKRTPARKESRSAIEEIARNDAIEKRIPYQPKKSSGLANSFSAGDDDVSLFSPKRRINSPSVSSDLDEHKQHGGFTFGSKKSEIVPTNTPSKSTSSLTSVFGSQSTNNDMFKTSSTTSVHSTTPKFSFSASQMSSKSTQPTEIDSVSVKETPAPSFKIDASKDNKSEHKSHGGFSFGVSPSDQIKPTQESQSTTPSESSDAHSAFGGFSAGSSTTFSPSFGLGTSTNNATEHKSHGGFTFGGSTATKGAFDIKASNDVSDSTESTPEEAADQDLMVHQLQTGSGDKDLLVHQLRDGTEYISPSKSRLQDSVSKSPSSASTSGFVFQPTHTKAASSFSFDSYKAPTSTPASAGGFSFDANKKVDIIGKTIGDAKPKPVSTLTSGTPASAPSESPRERVLALTEQQLEKYDFSSNQKVEVQGVRKEVLAAEIITFNFTTSPTSAFTTTTKKPSGGFDWSAAGLKKPEAAGWTCDVCMVSNKPDASKCVSCESDGPGAVAQIPTASSTPAPSTNGGTFNWAAAGMKKPDEQWTCSVCMVSNPMDKNVCLSCETEK